MKATLLIFLFPLLAQATENGTKLCDEDKENEYWNQIDACTSLAELDYIVQISTEDIMAASCSLIEKTLKCFDDIEATYNCLDESQKENLRDNTLWDEIGKARNNSAFLGDAYLASCPILLDFQRDYVAGNYGETSPCTFAQIQDKLQEKEACGDKVSVFRNFLFDKFSGQRAALTRVICLTHDQYDECVDDLYTCFDEEHLAEQELKNAKIYEENESFYRSIGFDGFTYASECEDSDPKRVRRFTNEFVSPAQMDQLRNHFSA